MKLLFTLLVSFLPAACVQAAGPISMRATNGFAYNANLVGSMIFTNPATGRWIAWNGSTFVMSNTVSGGNTELGTGGGNTFKITAANGGQAQISPSGVALTGIGNYTGGSLAVTGNVSSTAGIFYGNGSGLTNANATTLLGSGSVPMARLPSNIITNNQSTMTTMSNFFTIGRWNNGSGAAQVDFLGGSGTFSLDGTSKLGFSAAIGVYSFANFVPQGDRIYDLGDSTHRWRNFLLYSNLLHVGTNSYYANTNLATGAWLTASNGALSAASGVRWQGGAQLTNIYTATATLDFGNVATIGCADLTMTVTGAAVGDVVDLGYPDSVIVANSSYSAWVSAADTVTVRFCALISGDPASGVFRAEVHKWK